jgi:thiol-disulfide isomerase/thioredoxin
MKLFFALVSAVLLAVPAFSIGTVQDTGEATALTPLPEINLQDFDGKKVAAGELKGNILVLDFWATWCKPCLAEIPVWNNLQQKYGDKGLKVIGVTLTSGDAKDVTKFFTENPAHKMKYTVLMGDDDQTYDFNIVGFPTTILVTKDMKIYRRYVGTSSRKAAQIEADIQKLLAQK